MDRDAPVRDPSALASRWRDLIVDPLLRKAEGVLARERVVADFDLMSTVRAYERLYEAQYERARARP